MSFDEVINWLGNSSQVTNLRMFCEGLWTWMLTNKYKHQSPTEVLPILIEIKERRGWTDIYDRWLNMWSCEKNDLISIIQNNEKLCSSHFDKIKLKYVSVFTRETFKNVTSIFERETELYFDIRGSAALDKRNCLSHERCALILKTVPAKDGANVVLCTDPAEYPDNMHFHKEFLAKDMHLTAYVDYPDFPIVPLSWLGTPVIKDGRVNWGESLSKLSNSKCFFHLIVCIA